MKNPNLDDIRNEVAKLSREDQVELALQILHGGEQSSPSAQEISLSDLKGNGRFPIDALLWQQQVRAEWDR